MSHQKRHIGSREVTAPARFTLALLRRGGEDYSRGDKFRRRLPAGTARLSVGSLPIPSRPCQQPFPRHGGLFTDRRNRQTIQIIYRSHTHARTHAHTHTHTHRNVALVEAHGFETIVCHSVHKRNQSVL